MHDVLDWTASMQQTYEYYVVDPGTWKDTKLLDTVKSSKISRDSDAETLGSASIDISNAVGECYIRIYLVAIQNGVREKIPLGTFLVQTPSSSFDGKVRDVSMDAYTPLIELKEKQPPLGYYVKKKENIMSAAYKLVRENLRAPVVSAKCNETLATDFVADINDTQLTFITDLVANADYTLYIDEMGRVLFSPKQDAASLCPVWTFDDGNSSILQAQVSMDHDLYGVPNVVEVIFSEGSRNYYSRVVNDDPNSPTSTVNRGREIIHRITDPDIASVTSQTQVKEYAEKLLKELSTLEYTVTYTHGYCPVRLGDCVRLDYERAGLTDIKAKVISQDIDCVPGCPVTEKAVFTANLWR